VKLGRLEVLPSLISNITSRLDLVTSHLEASILELRFCYLISLYETFVLKLYKSECQVINLGEYFIYTLE